MELLEAITRRRMVRSFADRSIPMSTIDQLLDVVAHAPSAGNTRGTAWITLLGPEHTWRYWDNATTPEWRQQSPRWPGLKRAPTVLLSLTSPEAYAARYDEVGKRGSGLGSAEGGPASWPIPYWFGDAAFETLLVLLRATDLGLASCFLGNFRGEERLLHALHVPSGWRLFGAVLVGYPDGLDHRSSSLDRPSTVTNRRHVGHWKR